MSTNPVANHLREQARILNAESNRYHSGNYSDPHAALYVTAADEIDRLMAILMDTRTSARPVEQFDPPGPQPLSAAEIEKIRVLLKEHKISESIFDIPKT